MNLRYFIGLFIIVCAVLSVCSAQKHQKQQQPLSKRRNTDDDAYGNNDENADGESDDDVDVDVDEVEDNYESKRQHCSSTQFGCCSDNKTPAKGPFKEGCIDYSCKHSEFGCCDDLVTPAKSYDLKRDCPTSCHQSLYGCCPDNRQASRGLGYAGCANVVPCSQSEFGCCDDGITHAQSRLKENCAEFSQRHSQTATTNQQQLAAGAAADVPEEKKIVNLLYLQSVGDVKCVDTKYECCPDGLTPASVRYSNILDFVFFLGIK